MAQRQKPRESNTNWLITLKEVVNNKPLVLFRFSEDEWESLRNSRRGTNKFTFACKHKYLDNLRVPTACLLAGSKYARDTEIYFGLLKSRSRVTTLESRLKITSTQSIAPSSEKALLELVTDQSLKSILRSRLESGGPVVRLSPAVSVHLIDKLAERQSNRRVLRTVVAILEAPATYSSNIGLQEDAITLSLKAVGLSADVVADVLEVADDRDTALTRFNILEDAVIEHDAKVVPGFTLSQADLTGRAVFRNGSEVLEVITANKRPLEEVLGIDLIYLNAIKQNIVMVQYKMLERSLKSGQIDWLYRPDGQLEKEMNRMKCFSHLHVPSPLEYRINPQVYYLRFVRRDATLGKNAVMMPIDHFETLRNDPGCKGPKGAFRISYDTLHGRYLRQEGFLNLVRSGYIGAYAQTTNDLTNLIKAILKSGRSVVAAAQSFIQYKS